MQDSYYFETGTLDDETFNFFEDLKEQKLNAAFHIHKDGFKTDITEYIEKNINAISQKKWDELVDSPYI